MLSRVTKVTLLSAHNSPANVNSSPLYKRALKDSSDQRLLELRVHTRSSAWGLYSPNDQDEYINAYDFYQNLLWVSQVLMPWYLQECHLHLEETLLLSPSHDPCLGPSLLREGKLSKTTISMGGSSLLIREYAAQAEPQDMLWHQHDPLKLWINYISWWHSLNNFFPPLNTWNQGHILTI